MVVRGHRCVSRSLGDRLWHRAVVRPRLLRRSLASTDAEIGAARQWALILAAVSAAIAVAVAADLAVTFAIVGGLIVFGIVFAINSSLHSY